MHEVPTRLERAIEAGGEAGALVRSHAWEQTQLGPMAAWPSTLAAAVNTCLATGFPMVVNWGKQLVQIYNDAAIPVYRKRTLTPWAARHARTFRSSGSSIQSRISSTPSSRPPVRSAPKTSACSCTVVACSRRRTSHSRSVHSWTTMERYSVSSTHTSRRRLACSANAEWPRCAGWPNAPSTPVGRSQALHRGDHCARGQSLRPPLCPALPRRSRRNCLSLAGATGVDAGGPAAARSLPHIPRAMHFLALREGASESRGGSCQSGIQSRP